VEQKQSWTCFRKIELEDAAQENIRGAERVAGSGGQKGVNRSLEQNCRGGDVVPVPRGTLSKVERPGIAEFGRKRKNARAKNGENKSQ